MWNCVDGRAAADADSAAAKYNYRMTDNFLELGNDNPTRRT